MLIQTSIDCAKREREPSWAKPKQPLTGTLAPGKEPFARFNCQRRAQTSRGRVCAASWQDKTGAVTARLESRGMQVLLAFSVARLQRVGKVWDAQ